MCVWCVLVITPQAAQNPKASLPRDHPLQHLLLLSPLQTGEASTPSYLLCMFCGCADVCVRVRGCANTWWYECDALLSMNSRIHQFFSNTRLASFYPPGTGAIVDCGVKAIAFSGWNPPAGNRRLQGTRHMHTYTYILTRSYTLVRPHTTLTTLTTLTAHITHHTQH